jgi:endonuclease-3 related protein
MFSETLRKLRAELLSVSGIGNETADSILLYAGQKRSFVVDAYTRRIFSRHHFFEKTAAYEEIQVLFTDRLPRSTALFNDYHAQIVECAKRYCRTIPRCESCPLRFLFDLEK